MRAQETESAEQLLQDSEYGSRKVSGFLTWLIPAVALCWTLFQLALPSVLLLNALYIRAIHLAFAMALVFLCFPAFKRARNPQANRYPWLDILLAVLAPACALYIVFDYEGLSVRQGLPLTRDLVLGGLLIFFLLEASRRAVGPALSLVAIGFITYAFLGPYMPGVVAFKGVSLERFMGQLTMSTEGVYGVPLDVSANIVFMFVLFGAMLEKAGGGEYFVQLAFGLLGRFRGGPAKAAVVASALTGMINGSSIANTVTTGTFTIPLMKRVGYPNYKAAAVEVASSTNGQLTPPIMGAAAFIIAEYTNLSYFEVVVAAAIPALVSYIGLLYITHLEALKLNLEGLDKKVLPNVWQTFKAGMHYILPLIVLIFELMVMRHSPQLAAFRAVALLALIMLLQHPIKAWLGKSVPGRQSLAGLNGIKQGALDVLDGLIKGARNMVAIAIATATAGIVVGVVTMGLGGLINDIVAMISGGNILLMLLITAVACLLLGMGLPTTANYIVMASLTAPVIVHVGLNNGFIVPLIAAHLFVFYFGILADDTPPVGLAAYAAAAIAKSDPIRTGVQGFAYDIRTAILPFMFIFNTEILLIGVETVHHGLFIFAMCALGMLAFTCATQNYFIRRNKPWEMLLFLLIAFMFLRPGFFATQLDRWLPRDNRMVLINEIDYKIKYIMKDFDFRAEELPEVREKLERLEPTLTEEDRQHLLKTLQVQQWEPAQVNTAFMLLEFDQHRTEQLHELVRNLGTSKYWFYGLAVLLFGGMYWLQSLRPLRR